MTFERRQQPGGDRDTRPKATAIYATAMTAAALVSYALAWLVAERLRYSSSCGAPPPDDSVLAVGALVFGSIAAYLLVRQRSRATPRRRWILASLVGGYLLHPVLAPALSLFELRYAPHDLGEALVGPIFGALFTAVRLPGDIFDAVASAEPVRLVWVGTCLAFAVALFLARPGSRFVARLCRVIVWLKRPARRLLVAAVCCSLTVFCLGFFWFAPQVASMPGKMADCAGMNRHCLDAYRTAAKFRMPLTGVWAKRACWNGGLGSYQACAYAWDHELIDRTAICNENRKKGSSERLYNRCP